MKILNNDLFKTRNEGIFIIKFKGGLIIRNKFLKIMMEYTCLKPRILKITENDIYLNVRSGYLIANNSETKKYQIQIIEN